MLTRHRYSIRQCLLAFGVAILTPGLILAAVLLWQFTSSERSRYEQEARDTAQRIVAAVDRELVGLQAAAQALATSASLLDGSYEAFQQQALATLRSWARSPDQPNDYAIVVRDVTGQQVANTRLPWGSPLPKGANLQIDQDVIRTKQPVIQDLFTGATAGRPIISIRVPVQKDGEVTHVLSVAVEPKRFAEVLQAQALPSSWIATVTDRADRVVARSHQHEAFLGKSAPAEFRNTVRGDQGIWQGRNLEGAKVMGAYARSGLSGWQAFVGVPAKIAQGPLRQSVWTLVVLGAVLFTLAFPLAVWFGRRIASPVAAVSRAAQRLGRGEAVSMLATGLVEIDQVGGELAAASTELQTRESALRQSESRLRATHENAAVGIVEVDQEGRFVSVNEARCRLTGHTREELIGNHFGFSTNRPDLVRDVELFQQQVAGERDAYTVENQFTRKDGTGGWVRVSCTAVRDASGKFLYAVRIVEDITERKQAEERQRLLIDELNHRVKNTLATVQSLAWQSARQGVSPEAAQERFQGRLLALSRTHNLLNETLWEGACLKDILRVELEPYASDPGRVHLEGSNVNLLPGPAVVLGMAIHELATNAAKYGALSSEIGHVRVVWRVDSQDGTTVLTIVWCEVDGPKVEKPTILGFGSRLIRQTITKELSGKLDIHFEPDGVCCTIVIPLRDSAQQVA
jgi:PAS domain S-box-containing protein